MKKIFIKNFLRFGSALMLMSLIAACNNGGQQNASNDDHDHAEHAGDHDHDHEGHDHDSDVVRWAALSELDEEIHHAVFAIESGNNVSAESGEEILSLLKDLVDSEVPENAKNPEQVEVLLSDIGSIVDLMEIGTGTATDHTKSLFPIVEKLVVESGVPHVHSDHDDDHGDHGEGHDDHDGHDHDDHDH